MNKDKYVFAQLIEFLNNDKFRRLVDKYDGTVMSSISPAGTNFLL